MTSIPANLQDFLVFLASGAIGYWPLYSIIERFGKGNLRWQAYSDTTKRWIVLACAVVLAVIAWLALVLLGYAPAPTGSRAWIEAFFDIVWKVGGAAFAASQVRHANEADKEERLTRPSTPPVV